MQVTPERRTLLTDLAASLADRGVRALVLRGPNLPERDEPAADGHRSHTAHEIVLLVRGPDAAPAREVLERTPWRFELGDRGPWRWFRTSSYLYDDHLGINLMWGIPGAPLPFRRLRALEEELWACAVPGPYGFLEAEAEVVLGFLATQAARLGLRRSNRHESWFEDVAACARRVGSWDRVHRIAEATGVEESLRRALALAGVDAEAGSTGRGPGPTVRGLWSATTFVQRHGRPRRIRAYVAAAPRLSQVTARVGFGGVVLEVGPGVFVPRGLAETIVDEAARTLAETGPGVVVDVGTGCGPIALALCARVPGVEVHATEISGRALLWAARNRRRLGLRHVHFHRGSILDPIPDHLAGSVRVMTANVPYVPLAEWHEGWRGRESQVVGSDADGLGLYRRLATQAPRFLAPAGRLIIQLEEHQWSGFSRELRALGYLPGDVIRRWGSDVVVSATVAAG